MSGTDGHDRTNGKARKSSIVLRSALEIAIQSHRANWLLKPLVPRSALVLMYGAEGTYKSFLALDWALQIAKAGEAVVFLHAEGRGLWKRLRAWSMRHYPTAPWSETLNGVPFLAVERPLNLSADSVLEELRLAITETGRKPALVVVDTISRNSDGTVERSNEDANIYLNRLDQGIRAVYGASVILVHHIGHAARDRARGPFTLTGSTDANVRLERPDLKRRTVTVIAGRMKDVEPPQPYELEAEIITLDGWTRTATLRPVSRCAQPAPRRLRCVPCRRVAIRNCCSAHCANTRAPAARKSSPRQTCKRSARPRDSAASGYLRPARRSFAMDGLSRPLAASGCWMPPRDCPKRPKHVRTVRFGQA